MPSQLINIINLIGKTAAAQLSGPWGFVAKIVLSLAIKILDYYKIKHELKQQSEQKLEDFEKALKDLNLTDAEKDEARRNFLK